ncbi:bZIP transcription factor 27-like [Zingiber officinale]|uniref:bZIP transcription factor 27-like n=1 Tax=Zingiber officinale TaxID=94328 RepID=UPI001C4D4390|nr:bZIP transcription factor 27-like [Zingiber officinale]
MVKSSRKKNPAKRESKELNSKLEEEGEEEEEDGGGVERHELEHSPPSRHSTNPLVLLLPAQYDPFSALSGAGFDSSRKQLPDPSVDSRERRKKRMIKNRESAARSRARKQAYTNELEKEVDRLLNENHMLKRQYEQLRLEMAAHNLITPCKRKLYRTLTAPF